MSQIKSAEPAAVSTFPRWVIPSLIALAVVGVAMAVAQPQRLSLALHPHLPNLGLLAAQPMVIKIHLAAALAAIGLGAIMMLSRKGRFFHRLAGWTWVGLMALAAGSSLFITGLNGDHWSLIHLLAGWTLIVLPLGVMAARRHEVKRHRRTMMGLFYGGLLVAGVLAFIPGRLLWNLVLG